MNHRFRTPTTGIFCTRSDFDDVARGMYALYLQHSQPHCRILNSLAFKPALEPIHRLNQGSGRLQSCRLYSTIVHQHTYSIVVYSSKQAKNKNHSCSLADSSDLNMATEFQWTSDGRAEFAFSSILRIIRIHRSAVCGHRIRIQFYSSSFLVFTNTDWSYGRTLHS
jgi:hypothetical protein